MGKSSNTNKTLKEKFDEYIDEHAQTVLNKYAVLSNNAVDTSMLDAVKEDVTNIKCDLDMLTGDFRRLRLNCMDSRKFDRKYRWRHSNKGRRRR